MLLTWQDHWCNALKKPTQQHTLFPSCVADERKSQSGKTLRLGGSGSWCNHHSRSLSGCHFIMNSWGSHIQPRAHAYTQLSTSYVIKRMVNNKTGKQQWILLVNPPPTHIFVNSHLLCFKTDINKVDCFMRWLWPLWIHAIWAIASDPLLPLLLQLVLFWGC